MNKNKLLWALIVLVLFAGGWTIQTKPVVWEYKQTCSVKDMNKLGAEGWELVAATETGPVTCLFFKRAK